MHKYAKDELLILDEITKSNVKQATRHKPVGL